MVTFVVSLVIGFALGHFYGATVAAKVREVLKGGKL